jgi:hypothetical protein
VAFIQVASRPQLRPLYSGSGGGSLINGGTGRISGSGFGTKNATVISLKNTLDAAAAGTNLYDISALSSSGWSNCGGVESGSIRTKAQPTLPIYGTNSWECNNNGPTTFGVAWDSGATIQDIFLRDYVRLNTAGSGGQWKMVRLGATACVTDDNLVNCYLSNQHGYSFDFFFTQKGNGCGAGGASGVNSNPITSYNTTFGVWYERQIRLKPSTAAAATDGIIEVTFRRVSDWVEVSNNSSTTQKYYDTGEVNRNRYLILQNYQGNGSFDSTQSIVYMDATWISNGDQARVYLSTASTWTAVLAGAPREIQDPPPGGWGSFWTNTDVDFTVRQGMLPTLTGVYGYVVDTNGNVNANGILPVAT